LPDSVEAELANHLSSCSACRNESLELEQLWSNLGAIPPAGADLGALRERFYSMLEREQMQPSREWGSRWFGFVQGAAALLLLGLGFWMGSQRSTGQELADLRSELGQVRQVATLALLQQPSASERLRGASWSREIAEPGEEVVTTLLDMLKHDPNVNVRLACLEALTYAADQRRVRVGAIEALNASEPALVQIALIDFLVGLKEKESIVSLRRLLDDSSLDETVRERARRGLEEIG
jgi:hypothetical protein